MDAWWFGRTLTGMTLGVVGMGDIGGRLARKAALACGMKIQYFNRNKRSEKEEAAAGGTDADADHERSPARFCSSLLELCETSDVVAVCVALNAATTGLIGKEHFEKMKKGWWCNDDSCQLSAVSSQHALPVFVLHV